MEWQEIQVSAILARNEENLWSYMKYGLCVSRRNGKGEILAARELYGVCKLGEKVMHTAHRTSTSHDAFTRLYALLQKSGYEEVSRKKTKEKPEGKCFFASKQYGLEHIEVYPGGSIDFRTRTNNGGLGEGFDLLIIDEAQEYTAKHEGALGYTVSASQNPQTILTGTPPTATSGGDVFGRLRKSIIDGTAIDVGWAEWSIETQAPDIANPDVWYPYNPSLGLRLSERNVRGELSIGEIDFNIQRLGLWLDYEQKSVITRAEWDALKVQDAPQAGEAYYIGVKFGRDGVNVAASIATNLADGKVFVEVLDCRSVREPTSWILHYLQNPKVRGVAIDGANGATILAGEVAKAGISAVIPKVGEIIVANSLFERAVCGQTLIHAGQPSLAEAASNVEKRAIGSNGGFGYRSLSPEHDVAIVDSVILAHWLCVSCPEEEPQVISY